MAIYERTGTVVQGKQLGARLGFPTANLSYDLTAGKQPPDGVYIGLADVGESTYLCILNQGNHPTSPKGKPTVEAHLLDYDGGSLYGVTIRLRYQMFVRPEQKFDTLDALRSQLKRDEAIARLWRTQNPNA